MSIILPASLEEIGRRCFVNTGSRTKVVCLAATPPAINSSTLSHNYNTKSYYSDDSFATEYGTKTLLVPEGTTAQYKASDMWKLFGTIEGVDVTGLNVVTADLTTSANTSVYDLQGRKLSKQQKGINIIGGKKVLVK